MTSSSDVKKSVYAILGGMMILAAALICRKNHPIRERFFLHINVL